MKMFLPIAALALCGCAHFTTTQEDKSYATNGTPLRTITTTATANTFFDSTSQLAQFKASQTDKSQTASVGNLTQTTSGSNTVNLVDAAVQAAVTAAIKSSAKP